MRHQRISQEESYSCRCSTTFPVDQKTMKKNASQMPNSFLCMQRDLESGTVSVKTVHKEYGTIWPKGCCWNSQKVDVQFSVLRLHCPESKGRGKLSIHFAANQKTIETVFRTIVSANQLSLYGAIAEICEEYETLHQRSGRPVVMGQSSSSRVSSVIKTEVPLDCDDPGNKDLPLQQYGERIQKLSQQDKLSKFCMDAGFLNVVEIGQYFRTKDTAEFSQFHAVANSSKRRRSITTKRTDPREHQDRARIGSCNLLFAW